MEHILWVGRLTRGEALQIYDLHQHSCWPLIVQIEIDFIMHYPGLDVHILNELVDLLWIFLAAWAVVASFDPKLQMRRLI